MHWYAIVMAYICSKFCETQEINTPCTPRAPHTIRVKPYRETSPFGVLPCSWRTGMQTPCTVLPTVDEREVQIHYNTACCRCNRRNETLPSVDWKYTPPLVVYVAARRRPTGDTNSLSCCLPSTNGTNNPLYGASCH